MKREDVFAKIECERTYQEHKWGPLNSDTSNVSSCILWMEHYLAKARSIASSQAEAPGTEGCEAAMHEIRKVIALGVFCAEANGIPDREGYENND